MRALPACFVLGASLTLVACSGSDSDSTPNAAGAGGSAASGAGSGGAAAGAPGGGSATGGAGGATGGAPSAGASNAGAAGQATAGAGGSAGGASGGSGGSGGAAGAAAGAGGTGGAAPFQMTSPAFQDAAECSNANKTPCQFFPSANVMMTIGGMNQSPEVNWTAGPAGTMSYVLCLHDLSFNNTHWCLWNIPGATRKLTANLARNKMPAAPAGSSQDSFNGSDDGYMGPGVKGNVYQFRLYALSSASYTPPNAENRNTVYSQLESDPNKIVLGVSTLRGRANPN